MIRMTPASWLREILDVMSETDIAELLSIRLGKPVVPAEGQIDIFNPSELAVMVPSRPPGPSDHKALSQLAGGFIQALAAEISEHWPEADSYSYYPGRLCVVADRGVRVVPAPGMHASREYAVVIVESSFVAPHLVG